MGAYCISSVLYLNLALLSHLFLGRFYDKIEIMKNSSSSQIRIPPQNVESERALLGSIMLRSESIEEIRMHHVFEHFPRAVAVALIVSWRTWLKVGGVLRIEVPDFKGSIRTYLSPFTSQKVRALTLRHLFGSQEQTWANHYEGWSIDNLVVLLEMFGFENIKVHYIDHKHMHNVEVIAVKTSKKLSKSYINTSFKKYFKQMLVDDSKSERDLLDVWYTNFTKQLAKTTARL